MATNTPQRTPLDFAALRTAVASQFARMQKNTMLRASISGDALWDVYLESFPPGTNEVFRERREHDCSACKHFVRAVGNAVAIIDGQLVTVWDISVPGYQPVVDALAARVRAAPVENVFLAAESKAGQDKSLEQLMDGKVRTWRHMFANIAAKHVVRADQLPTKLADKRDKRAVLIRGLEEISIEAIDTVLDLIAQKSLYRGEEHKAAVTKFRALKAEYTALSREKKALYGWVLPRLPVAVVKVRNTAIGTLLTDLSNDVGLEEAVGKFEAMVAPTNYRRPTALVTPKMIEQAKETIVELGLGSALDRRHAVLADVNINDLLFADRAARSVINGDVFDDLLAATPGKAQDFSKVQEVPIDKFLQDIVPRAESIDMLVENRLTAQRVSLIAPVDPTAGRLFQWDNGFSWAYAGDAADSIRARVKKAGGSVVGDLCCRLAWSNRDDLDIHMSEPSGEHIYFGHRNSRSGGQLDVDMNVNGETREPVENIYYADRRKMREGVYALSVHQYTKRETSDVGFEVEVDFMGAVTRFAYPKAVRSHENVRVAKFRYTHAGGIEMLDTLPSSSVSKTVWGISTAKFHRVETIMLSPNRWGDQASGNKHYIFTLEGMKNDEGARGFFNEFLRSDLTKHRKVFEIVGGRMKAPETDEQLSGLGFSSTQQNYVVCRVKGRFNRTIKVTF